MTNFPKNTLSSVLQVYINSDLLTMVRTLTTGASVAEYEQILADGLGLSRQQSLVDVSAARNRCRVAQLSLDDSRLTHLQVHLLKLGTRSSYTLQYI